MRGEGGARDVRQEITQALRFSKRGKLRGIYDMATRTITMLSCQTIEEALPPCNCCNIFYCEAEYALVRQIQRTVRQMINS